MFQVCRVIVQVRDEDTGWVRLTSKNVELTGVPELLDFSIEDIRLDSFDNSSDGQGIKLSLFLRRKLSGELFSTFLPSLLVLALSHLSSIFHCPFKPATLLNLVCFLAVALFSCNSLLRRPSTSSFKMVDIWLLICYLTIISRLVLLMASKQAQNKTSPYKSTKVIIGNLR